ncbi:MAG TPA: STAS domain-containing protein [bacterium]|nr:MAG: Anti-sigma F factor antagonist [bacterium ADurb.Bin236]HOY61714.1 STAS domain-containing protein [bacterium]HPI75305.1 STAS domain-containing protein [bacterium]HPN94558.1 STAS domain-containing protein [bacterium]
MRVNEFEYRARVVDSENGTVAVDLVGGVFMSNMEDFRRAVKPQLGIQVKNLVLNFKDMDFISSSGIGLLVESSQSFKKAGKQIWVVGLEGELARVFDQFSLRQILMILPDEKDALEKIASARG